MKDDSWAVIFMMDTIRCRFEDFFFFFWFVVLLVVFWLCVVLLSGFWLLQRERERLLRIEIEGNEMRLGRKVRERESVFCFFE